MPHYPAARYWCILQLRGHTALLHKVRCRQRRAIFVSSPNFSGKMLLTGTYIYIGRIFQLMTMLRCPNTIIPFSAHVTHVHTCHVTLNITIILILMHSINQSTRRVATILYVVSTPYWYGKTKSQCRLATVRWRFCFFPGHSTIDRRAGTCAAPPEMLLSPVSRSCSRRNWFVFRRQSRSSRRSCRCWKKGRRLCRPCSGSSRSRSR